MRPFPLGAPLHPSPCPGLVLPCASPSTVLTPKSFPGGFQKAFWGGVGVFLGGRFYSASPWAKPWCPTKPLPPLRALPVGFNFWGSFGGFFYHHFHVAVQVLHVSLCLRGSFQILVFTCFIWGKKPQKPTKTNLSNVLCIQFLGPFSKGREIFP